MNFNYIDLLDKISAWFFNYAPKVLGALILLIVGLLVIKRIIRLVTLAIQRSNVDPTLEPFLVSVSRITLKVLLIVSVLSMLQANMTSFIAMIGASSLAIGLAFQGALSNFAGGVLLLALRPFKIGDYIEGAGCAGTVEAIHVFNTIVITPDNKVISIPNGKLSNDTIVNYSLKPTRRIDLNFGVSYEQDIDKVKDVLTDVCNENELILQEPAPFVTVAEHADSAVIFLVRIWTASPDYWTVKFGLMETVKKRFDKEDITIPFPQLDVHMDK